MTEALAGGGLRRSQMRTFPDDKIVYTALDDEKIPVPADWRSEKILVQPVEAETYSHAQVYAPDHNDKFYVPHAPQQHQQHYPHPHYRQYSGAVSNYGYPQDKPYGLTPDGYPVQYAPSGPPPYMNNGDYKSHMGPAYSGSRYPQDKPSRYHSTLPSPHSPSSYGLEPLANLSLSDGARPVNPPSQPTRESNALNQKRASMKPGTSLVTLTSSPVRIGKGDIWNTATETAIFSMGTEARADISSLSSKALLAVRRSHDKSAMGYIQFSKQAGGEILMFINAQATVMSQSGLLHPRWEFISTSGATHEEKWHWKRDKTSGGVVLMGGKKSAFQLARMKGDHLYFEKTAKLTETNFDEIVLSAIAFAEAVRRAGRDKTRDAANSMASMLFADSASVMSGTTSFSAQSAKTMSSQDSKRSGRTSWSFS